MTGEKLPAAKGFNFTNGSKGKTGNELHRRLQLQAGTWEQEGLTEWGCLEHRED